MKSILLSLSICTACTAAQPTYAQDVRALLTQLGSSDYTARQDARRELKRLAGYSTPNLIDALQDVDYVIRVSALVTLAEAGLPVKEVVPHLIRALADKHPVVRLTAATVLAEFDSESKTIVASLTSLLSDPNLRVRHSVVSTLVKVSLAGKTYFPELTLAIKDRSPYVRREVVAYLSGIGRQATDAVPALMESLNDSDYEVRRLAIKALITVAGESESTVLAITAKLRDKRAEVRRESLIGLRSLGQAASSAVPAIISSLNDRATSVRKEAIISLSLIGPSANSAIPGLTAALNNQRSEIREAAAVALLTIGADALPHLVAKLKNGDSKVCKSIMKASMEGHVDVGSLPALLKAMRDRNNYVSHFAVNALSAIGSAAVKRLAGAIEDEDVEIQRRAIQALVLTQSVEAVPALIKALKTPHLCGEAIIGLINVGDAAIPALRDAAKNQDPRVRKFTIIVLREMMRDYDYRGPDEPRSAVISELIFEALDDEKYDVRRVAVMTVGALGRPSASKESLRRRTDSLVKALKDPHHDVRAAAAVSLSSIEAETADANQALIEALRDSAPLVREAAAGTLGKIGPTINVRSIPSLIEAVRDQSPDVRIAASLALGNCEAKAEQAAPTLVNALSDQVPAVRHAAAISLTKIGADAKYATKTMIASLNSGDVRDRKISIYALGRIKPDAEIAVPALLSALKDKRIEIRCYAADALGQIGPEANAAIPALKAAINDPNVNVRGYAMRALGSIGQDAIPVLLRLLEGKDRNLRSQAVASLSRGGKNIRLYADAATPTLIAALRHPATRYYAASALETIGQAAIPSLIAALKSKNPATRLKAAHILGQIGDRSDEVITALIGALGDEDLTVRRNAAYALYHIGPNAVIAAIKSAKSNGAWSQAMLVLDHIWLNDKVFFQPIISEKVPGEPAVMRDWGELVHALISLLNDENYEARQAAQKVLERAGQQATFMLLNALRKGEKADVRKAAIRFFSEEESIRGDESGGGAKENRDKNGRDEVISALIVALGDENDEIRCGAVEALGMLRAQASVEALTKALSDKSAQARKGAALALERIGDLPKETIPVLVGLLKDVNPAARQAAARALVKTGAGSTVVVASLIEALGDGQPDVRKEAALSLGQLGEAAKSAVPPLIAALKDVDDKVRALAAQALGKIGAEPEITLPALNGALQDRNDDVIISAAWALGKFGAAAVASVPALIAALKNPDAAVRKNIAWALKRIGVETSVPALTQQLKEKRAGIDTSAIYILYALAAIGPEDEVIKALTLALRNRDPLLRHHAALALGKIGPAAGKAVVPLTRALRDHAPRVRAAAAEALGKIGETVEDTVLNTIIGPAAKSHFPVLPPKWTNPIGRPLSLWRYDYYYYANRVSLPKLRTGRLRIAPLSKGTLDYPIMLRRASKASHYLADDSLVERDVEALLRSKDLVMEILISDADVALIFETIGRRVDLALFDKSDDDKFDSYKSKKSKKGSKIRISRPIPAQNRPQPASPEPTLPSSATLPSLPWPPPQPSAFDEMPREWFGGDKDQLYGVYHRLASALDRRGYEEKAVFAAPGGFAIITNIERLKDDGTPSEPYRWWRGKIPLTSFDPRTFFSRLFFGEKQQYRMVVLAVTTQGPQGNSRFLDDVVATEWLRSGWRGRDLPGEIGRLTFGGRRCYAIIYHFIKKGKKPALAFPSDWSARQHLEKTGLWSVLSNR